METPNDPSQKSEASKIPSTFEKGSKSESRTRHTRGRPPDHQILGPANFIGEGDSRIIHANPLNYPLKPFARDPTSIFHALKSEVRWLTMHHQHSPVPRLISVQGTVSPIDGSKPIYRHPSDHSPQLDPYIPTTAAICAHVEQLVQHPMNHCLLQLYRGGTDFISEHSDKTLDIAHGSPIVNVSLGAQRTMRLRTKRRVDADGKSVPRRTQLVPLPHGSVFVLGPRTNARWLHGINADRRPEKERSEEEGAFGGERISLTFRCIATYLDKEETVIWGQGAKGKTRETGGAVVNGVPGNNEEMIRAFGRENQETEEDWEGCYGEGFDVLHFSAMVPGEVGRLATGKEDTE